MSNGRVQKVYFPSNSFPLFSCNVRKGNSSPEKRDLKHTLVPNVFFMACTRQLLCCMEAFGTTLQKKVSFIWVYYKRRHIIKVARITISRGKDCYLGDLT